MIALLLDNLPTWKANICKFVNTKYADGISNFAGLSVELELWQRMWFERKNNEDIPQKISKVLKVVDPESFPNIQCICHFENPCNINPCNILFLSAVTIRSVLLYLKNYLRGTMWQGRLNQFVLMQAHCEIDLAFKDIINLFASCDPRRMRIANILCSAENT